LTAKHAEGSEDFVATPDSKTINAPTVKEDDDQYANDFENYNE
jgi:hypothetical protein